MRNHSAMAMADYGNNDISLRMHLFRGQRVKNHRLPLTSTTNLQTPKGAPSLGTFVDKTNRRANRGKYLHFGIEPKANTGSERDEPQTTVDCPSIAVILMPGYSVHPTCMMHPSIHRQEHWAINKPVILSKPQQHRHRALAKACSLYYVHGTLFN